MPVLRPCSVALANVLTVSGVPYQADLFDIALQNTTLYRWCTWDSDLRVGGNPYLSSAISTGGTWLSRGKLTVHHTMEVPTLEVFITDNTLGAFTGGGTTSLRRQIHDGLFDGASVALQRVYMPTPGDTATYGTILLFKGDVGAITLSGAKATLKVRGKNSRLNVMAPRNVYQPNCIHTFCDPGCTLSAATFTFARTIQASPAPTPSVMGIGGIIGSANMQGGTVTFTSGANTGLSRGIIAATGLVSAVITLAYPLPFVPVAGDTLSLFQGCDKTLNTCNVTYANKVNFRGFPFMPPPATTAAGQ